MSVKTELSKRIVWYALLFGMLANIAATVGFAGSFGLPMVLLGAAFGCVPFSVILAWFPDDRTTDAQTLCCKVVAVLLAGLSFLVLFQNALHTEEIHGAEQMSVAMLPILLLVLNFAVVASTEAILYVHNAIAKMRHGRT